MKIIVCLDDRSGMLFLKRRQSQDSALRQKLLERTAGSVLWMNRYSAGQFTEGTFRVDEQFLDKAGAGEYCFVENADILPCLDRIEGVIVYRWNRHYPSDMKFPTSVFAERWKLMETREFPGSSHDLITEEVYTL